MQDQFSKRLDAFARKARGEPQPFQLGRLFAALASPYGADESCPEFAAQIDGLRARGLPADGRHALVPLAGLTRALTADTPSAGGNVAGNVAVEVTDSLREFSVIVDGGARVRSLAAGSLGIASFSSGIGYGWLENEGDAVSESDPAVARVTGAPMMLSTAPVDISRSLLKHTDGLEEALAREILTTKGKAIDAAAINGSGAAGQPAGALTVSGTIAQSGTSFAHAGAVAMLRQAAARGVRRERMRWLCDPLAFATLAGRERASGSGFLIDDFKMLGLPVDIAEGAPDNSLVLLDPADITLLMWGDIIVRSNPYHGATTGAVRFDCQVAVDILIPVPGRIAKSTSIT